MPRWLTFFIFFFISFVILGLVHYYFYRRLVMAPQLPQPWRKGVKIAFIVLPLSFPLSFFILRTLNPSIARFILYPIYIWLGMMLMLFFLLLVIDVAGGVAWIGAKLAGQKTLVTSPERRLLLSRIIAGTAIFTVTIASSFALWHGLAHLVVKRIEVVLPKLPKALDGFSIVQLTDLHLGAMRWGDWVHKVVERTNALKPDLIAITGDLADASVEQLQKEMEMLQKLKAKHGVFFVTGNHEYFIDLNGWLKKLRKMGFRVLRNERVAIHHEGEVFYLAGIDDHEGRRFEPGHGDNLAKALDGRNPDRLVILLAHQPRAVIEASKRGVDLVLSGHTHGGQIWPWNKLVYLQQPYVSGLHNHRGTLIYISQGTGFWGPPMRLGSTAEISQVILRAH